MTKSQTRPINRMVALLRRVIGKKGRQSSWQAQKANSSIKADLIEPELNKLDCKSLLDIGCNAGEIARRLSHNRFVVGLDGNLDTRGFACPFDGVALGNVRVCDTILDAAPSFDAILLLSVHHQWYASMDKKNADNLLSAVMGKARKALFIEFSAINEKYGCDQGFVDNDAESVKAYAKKFLGGFISEERIKYLGACPEFPEKEPFRYMFLVRQA